MTTADEYVIWQWRPRHTEPAPASEREQLADECRTWLRSIQQQTPDPMTVVDHRVDFLRRMLAFLEAEGA